MAVVAAQAIGLAGAATTYSAASAGGDEFAPGDNVFIHVKNANGSACVVTIVTPGTVAGQAIADLTVSVPATTGERFIGPFRSQYFGAPADGNVDVSWSVTASVTFAVLRV